MVMITLEHKKVWNLHLHYFSSLKTTNAHNFNKVDAAREVRTLNGALRVTCKAAQGIDII